jgi:putative membrane protein
VRPAEEQHPPLADYRFSLANERTFLSWTRTGLALIAGGVAVEQFATLSLSWLVEVIAVAAIVLGGGIAAHALRHFRKSQHAIDHDRPLPAQPAAAVVAVGIGVLAALLIVGILVA